MVKLSHIQSIEQIYTAFEDERTINSLTKKRNNNQLLVSTCTEGQSTSWRQPRGASTATATWKENSKKKKNRKRNLKRPAGCIRMLDRHETPKAKWPNGTEFAQVSHVVIPQDAAHRSRFCPFFPWWKDFLLSLSLSRELGAMTGQQLRLWIMAAALLMVVFPKGSLLPCNVIRVVKQKD